MTAIPSDAKTIFSYLTGQGYSAIAASGIIGNMFQESALNPESGSQSGNGGLIGWTPSSSAGPKQPIITGNKTRDLQTQLIDVIQWGKNDNAPPGVMNKATTAAEAATMWMNIAERPAPATANLANRIAMAQAVLAASKSGNWPSSASVTPSNSTGGSAISSDILGGIAGDLLNPFLASLGVSSLTDLFERAGLVIFGIILIVFGVIKLGSGGHSARSSSGYFDNDSGSSGDSDDEDTEIDTPVDDKQLEKMYDKAEREGRTLDQQHDRNEAKQQVRNKQSQSMGRARAAGPGPKSIKEFGRTGPGLASEGAAAGAGAGTAAVAPELAEAAVVAV